MIFFKYDKNLFSLFSIKCFCFVLVFIIVGNSHLYAQNIEFGTPPIRNFTKKTYAASPQNWQISQRKDGMMLFANNLGLLCFNGNAWKTYSLNNHTIARSVLSNADRRIYIGGQGEFGYFDQKNGSHLQYIDLTGQVPLQFRNFSDVWNILSDGKKVFFQTSREVFIYDSKQLRVYYPGKSIRSMFMLDRTIYVQTEGNTYAAYDGSEFRSTKLFDNLKNDIVDVCRLSNGKIWIATYKSGIYVSDGRNCRPLPLIKTGRITTMSRLTDNRILIGTTEHGLFVTDTAAHILLALNKASGLLNNSVLDAKEDRDGNLWVTTESGIDFIEYKSPYRFLFPDLPANGTGYSMAIFKNKLYLGTSNGLYFANLGKQFTLNNNPFREVAGSKDICWNLDTLGGNLWLGHNEGASLVNDDRLLPVYRSQGVWKFIPAGSGKILFGAYEGIGKIDKTGKSYHASIYPGFGESSRILVVYNNNQLWMSHPYRGIYKIYTSGAYNSISTKLYGVSKGLETDLDNYILSLEGKLYTSNSRGIFVYNDAKDRFEHDTILENIIGFEKGVKLLLADPYRNIWYRKGLKIGLLQPRKDHWKMEYHHYILPSLPESLAGGFEKVFPVSENEFIFNCESGFLLFDKRKLMDDPTCQTSVGKLSILNNKDSVIFSGIEADFLKYNSGSPLILTYKENNLRFDISCFSYSNKPIEYRYTLYGSGKNTVPWTSESFVTYNNLSAGSYKLKVETRIGDKVQTNPCFFHFEITPAWYNSFWFRSLVFLLFIVLITGLFLFQSRRYKTEKLQMAQHHREVVSRQADRVAQTEEELMRLKNEQLQRDIQFKNSELASIAMQLAHKKDFITTLEEELKVLQKEKLSSAEVANNLTRLFRRVKQEKVLDEDWQRFTHYFNEVNQNFILRLKEKYPNLTPHDHKLAAYLRMNLSTKDIAVLTNISIRGVEGSRYRLRKKMGLTNEDNLNEIMNNL